MDPLDHGRASLDGLSCAACDGPIPAGSVSLLAHRERLTVVRLACDACSSTTLAFLVEGSPEAEPPIGVDDVLDMHVLLRDWRGGLRELLGRDGAVPG